MQIDAYAIVVGSFPEFEFRAVNAKGWKSG